jgi:uncharacterized protein (DUF362 family)
MPGQYPCGGMPRRQFAHATALSMLGITAATAQQTATKPSGTTKSGGTTQRGKLGIPGPYPGRVVEVRNPSLNRGGRKDREAIHKTVNQGLVALTGADDPVEAWRTFVSPGECVGIKVVPNGHPGAPTSPELILEVIDGLKSAGIKLKDMVVFDRYRREFMAAGYQKILPAGVAWGGLTPDEWDQGQMKLKFDGGDAISGYDPDDYVQTMIVCRGQDPKDDRVYRSHLGRIVKHRLDKIIGLPCIKDHHAAGVTGALKNMSHGLVNNVFRSHSNPQGIAMNVFIPTVVRHPVIRTKCVLHIMDGMRAVWEGGPFGNDPKWLWDYNALLFATDPVAMDHIEWDIIDAKRKQMGIPGTGAVGRLAADPNKIEAYDIRQPQYIAMAGQVGLGLFDYKSPSGRRSSIDHRVMNIT